MRKLKLILAFVLFTLLGIFARPFIEPFFSGLPAEKPKPDLNKIYGRSIKEGNIIRNPVIVIPGMMGSKLKQRSTDRTVWGVFDKASIDPDVAEDVRLLACPINGENLDVFDDGVYASGVLDSVKIQIAGLALHHQAYLNILRMLGVGGYRDEELGLSGAIDYGEQHFSCFQFPYDWRRDNSENAKQLHLFLLQKKAYVEAERKKRYGVDMPVRFDIVAHSMGGLVARYYLRYGDQGAAIDGSSPQLSWAGCAHVDRLIMIGTPNSGSAKSLISVHEGFSLSYFLDAFPSGLVASLPSIYQLLPNGPTATVLDKETNKPLNHFDIETWDQRGWGMLNPNQDSVLQQLLPDVDSQAERRAIAKAHVAACLQRAKNFHAALNVKATPPEGTSIHLFVGDAIPTATTLTSDSELRTFEPLSHSPGDGTVTRLSAMADWRTENHWHPMLQSPLQFRDAHFLSYDHFGLTQSTEFTDNALYLLLEDPTKHAPPMMLK